MRSAWLRPTRVLLSRCIHRALHKAQRREVLGYLKSQARVQVQSGMIEKKLLTEYFMAVTRILYFISSMRTYVVKLDSVGFIVTAATLVGATRSRFARRIKRPHERF